MFRQGVFCVFTLAALSSLLFICVSTNHSRYSSLSSKAVEADVIFQGRIVSQPIRVNLSGNESGTARNNDIQPVTLINFTVERVLKGQFPFTTVDIAYENAGESVDRYDQIDGADQTRSTDDERPADRSIDVNVGMLYIVFVNTSRSTGSLRYISELYWSIGRPEPYAPRAQRAVLSVACKNCGQAPDIQVSPRYIHLREGQRLVLKCRTMGNPVPAISWLKDDSDEPVSQSANIVINRHGNILQVRRVSQMDSGVYWCRASNVLGSFTGAVAVVLVEPAVYENRQDHGEPCLEQDYCLNHGDCYTLPVLGQKFCRCTSNFSGPRCQNKNIATPSEVYDDTKDRFPLQQSLAAMIITSAVLAFLLFVALLVTICFQAGQLCSRSARPKTSKSATDIRIQ